jgi:predicted RNA polymerase sigma factor
VAQWRFRSGLRLGRTEPAREQYRRALELVGSDPEWRFLERQLASLDA